MYLARLILKHIQKRIVGINHISTTGMNYSFWLTCTSGCIEYEKGILRIHLHSREVVETQRLYFFDLIIPPDIPALYHAHRRMGTGINNHFFHKTDPNQ